MKAIYKHEMASCFHTLSGYIFISFLLFFAGIFTYAYNLHGGYASFQNVLGGITFVFLVIVPILTMRSFAEEKHQKTDTLLYSLPVKMPQVVLGKFFALVTILAMALAVVALIPLLLSAYGNVNMASSYGALIGFLFLGAALISVGLFTSSLTDSQAVSAGVCFLLLLVNYFLSSLSQYASSTSAAALLLSTVLVIMIALLFWIMTRSSYISVLVGLVLEAVLLALYVINKDWFSNTVPSIMKKLSLFDSYNTLLNGVFDFTVIVYFLTVMVFFLFLTVQSMEKRRWSD